MGSWKLVNRVYMIIQHKECVACILANSQGQGMSIREDILLWMLSNDQIQVDNIKVTPNNEIIMTDQPQFLFHIQKVIHMHEALGIASNYKGLEYVMQEDGTVGCMRLTQQDMTSVEIETGTTFLNDSLFSDAGVSSVKLPNTLLHISECAFAGSDVREIHIPDSVFWIANHAFLCCDHLRGVRLPKYLTKIEKSTFLECSSLQTVILPKGLSTLGTRCFAGCSSLKQVHLPDSLMYIETEAFRNSGLETLVLPKDLQKIGVNAFKDCDALKTVYVPKTEYNNPFVIRSFADGVNIIPY